ncbi:MAG: ATP-dependent sacrificial sulfur transferase LarE [Euryarchaeota archaeon]|nr:ATP-dependent sacrificial sulfur transferase LarE [Euryarchaeota archaeon]MDE1836974.1 ATP-dependent sacrificial sulfur transferase LarE [Euryarchaeota archaeon]MDE1880794.1 ATP-dependent sacrificial sulfur transferase LarE [Euryarchaeota archaeon]MDE2045841.1 ATP-dependent sacrificial sulfur transferase LarE [Thermoplasmata archaeon]
MTVLPTGPFPDRLEALLKDMGPVVVALSGGVDSSVVAAAAQRAAPGRSLAVTLHGPAVAKEELDRAVEVARSVGIRHRLVRIDPTQDPRYAANPLDRCYFCRSQEGDLLLAVAQEERFAVIVDGLHADDPADDRPGMRAMDERKVRHPLREAGLGKREVRELAAAWGLPNHDAPSNSCLASRVAHGEPISTPLLSRVEAGERALHELGFRQVRVRTSQGAARIEVGSEEVGRFQDPALRFQVSFELTALGFTSVTIDPEGYRPAGGRSWTAPSASGSEQPSEGGAS